MVHRLISLSISTEGAEDYFTTFQDISELARNLSESHGFVSLTAAVVGESSDEKPEQLYYDENTLMKVRDAITMMGISAKLATDLITNMQNAGILFRERPRT